MAAYVPHHSETQPFSSEAGRWPVRGFSLGNDLGSDAATRDGTSVKIRRRTALISVGLAATLALGYLTLFELIPVNRSPITITDPAEPGIPPDFNAVSLTGRQDQDTYVVTLTVLGTVQTTGVIHVGTLVQELRVHPQGRLSTISSTDSVKRETTERRRPVWETPSRSVSRCMPLDPRPTWLASTQPSSAPIRMTTW